MHADEFEAHVQREVARRVGQQVQALHQQVADQQETIEKCEHDLLKQQAFINQLSSRPTRYATLLDIQNHVDPTRFHPGDNVFVISSDSPYYGMVGKIIADPQSGETVVEGQVWVHLETQRDVRFHIGVEGGERAQIRLIEKDDGSLAVIAFDGKPWEIKTAIGFEVIPGDILKIDAETKQIFGPGREYISGPIHTVLAITDIGVEIEEKGDKKIVPNPRNLPLEEGDRIVLSDEYVILRKLEKDPRRRYKVSQDLNLTWDDIGGLEEAKKELREVLELPYQFPELFAHYSVDPVRGVLFYGPPGCGKTLLARVAAWAMAQQHGKQALESGYIYVKSPEILDKWVGNSEAEIRNLFERGRRHFREHGYKGILAFDEFDAIAPQRGTRRSSDVADTLVPMFLGEMDGLDSEQTKANPILIIMTNRADILDPAITRPGRIDKHIRIDRPTEMSAIDILKIHTDKLPFKKEAERMGALAVASADLYSKSRQLYRVNGEHVFTLGDACSGAMLANLAATAKMVALTRDKDKGTKTGLVTEDFRIAVKRLAKQQQGLNHSFDLWDFAERKGIQPQDMRIERCFGQ